MTQQQAEQVLATGFEAYEVAMLSYADQQPGEETPSQLLRRTIREECVRLGVAERDLYVLIPDAAYLKPEVITGWRGGPIRGGDPKVTPADGQTHLQWLAEEAVDRYERALADGLDADTAHRQAAGNLVIANDAIDIYAQQRAGGRTETDARTDAIVQATDRTWVGMAREGGALPPKSEWVRPAAVERPALERDAAPEQIAGEAIDYVTALIAVGVGPDEAEKAVEVTGFPTPQDAVREFRALLAAGASEADAREQVLGGLRAPAEFSVEDITSAPLAAPSDTEFPVGTGEQPAPVVFDPGPDLPPEVALTHYDLARSAVDDYEQRLAAGRDADQVRSEVLNRYPEDAEVVDSALELYSLFRSAGDFAADARDQAAADTVTRLNPQITPGQLDRVVTAFAADDAAEAEKAQQRQARLSAATTADSQTPDERTAEADPRDDLSMTGDGQPQGAPVRQAADQADAEYWAQLRSELDRISVDMTPERARATLAEAEQIRAHVTSCSEEAGQCETCSAHAHGDGVFWETDVPSAQRTLHEDNAPAVAEREPEPDGWIARNLPPQATEVIAESYEPDVVSAEADAVEQAAYDNGDEGFAPYVGFADAVSTKYSMFAAETAAVPADDFDERSALAEQVAECGQAVEAAEHAVLEAEAEDSERAEWCARWDAEETATELADEASEVWEWE